MKKIIKIFTSLLLLIIMSSSIFAFGGNGVGQGYGKNQGGQVITTYDDTQVNHQIEINSLPIEELSQAEIDGLILMREEEKLARDVYLELYDIWGQQIFSNIASSEETHTTAIKLLIERYDLEDPMTEDIIGEFENEELQTLYDSLVKQGSTTLVAALTVGATIEDLDIYDLTNLLLTTDNQDITAVYNNLNKGSRNHLRSFMKNLDRNIGTYNSQFISEEEFNSILSKDMETGTQYNSNGSSIQIEQMNKNSNQGQRNIINENNNLNQNNLNRDQNNQIENSNSVQINNKEPQKNQNMFQRMFSWAFG